MQRHASVSKMATGGKWQKYGHTCVAPHGAPFHVASIHPVSADRPRIGNSRDRIAACCRLFDIIVFPGISGAQGETRTRTVLLPGDFESPASTIPPLGPGAVLSRAQRLRPEVPVILDRFLHRA